MPCAIAKWPYAEVTDVYSSELADNLQTRQNTWKEAMRDTA